MHALIDKHLDERVYRLKRAVGQRNTTIQWDLIAAAVEDANIEFHGLTGAEAKKMKGRSRITFQKKDANALQAAEKQQGNEDLVTKAKWLRKTAGQHAKLGNKLLATAKKIKAAGYHRGKGQVDETNKKLIGATIHSYIMLAAEQAKKHSLTEEQKTQIKKAWQHKKESKTQTAQDEDSEGNQDDKHINDVQQAAQEFKELLVQVIGCDVTNTVQAAKIQRLGEMHIAKAKAFSSKVKAEIAQAKRQENDCQAKGIKNVSRSIGGPRAKPLMGVFRDKDTPDGGKAGQMTSDPAEIDAVVKRAWQTVYDGMGGCITTAVETYLEIYNKYILKMPEAELKPLDAQTVYDSFRRVKESAAALDGWSPKGLSLLSLQACGHVADMLNQIEAGSP